MHFPVAQPRKKALKNLFSLLLNLVKKAPEFVRWNTEELRRKGEGGIASLLVKKILSCLERCSSNLKTIVSFGNVSTAQKKEAAELGASCFSWGEFLQLGSLDWDLPSKKKTNICAIMYTSGTIGEPKGVIIKNEAFMAEVLSIDQILLLTDRTGTEDVYFFFLPLAHVYKQIIESYYIYKGSSIGFWQGC